MANPNGPSQRQLRVGELIRHELAGFFARGEITDPDIERIGITVLEVAASPDLKIATAYVRPLMVADNDALLAGLERNRRRIRGALAPKLKLKFMPDIRYRIDTAGDHANRIDELLRSPAVARDTDFGGGGAGESGPI